MPPRPISAATKSCTLTSLRNITIEVPSSELCESVLVELGATVVLVVELVVELVELGATVVLVELVVELGATVVLVELGATVVLVVELGATVVLVELVVELGATVVLVVELVESPSVSRRITRSSSNTTTSRSALRRRTSAASSSATKPFVTPS